MNKVLVSILLTLVFAPVALHAQGNHEYAPVQEKTVNYKNWTLNDLANNKPVSLRSLMQGKKLVMVLYFAPWCPNWRTKRRWRLVFIRNTSRRVSRSLA